MPKYTRALTDNELLLIIANEIAETNRLLRKVLQYQHSYNEHPDPTTKDDQA